MSIWHPIAELQLFQNLTLKFKGQGHGWGHSSKSQCECNILPTHIPFVPCWSALPFLRYSVFKISPWKSRVKVMGEVTLSQWGSNILSTHILFIPYQLALPFLRYSIFKIWPWKSRVKVMGEVTVQSHSVGLTSYQLTSFLFHVNQPSHSWDIAFPKFDLGNQGSRSCVRSEFKVTMWV